MGILGERRDPAGAEQMAWRRSLSGHLRLAVGFGALVVLGACSTVVKGTTQDIRVSSTPVSQANCTLSAGDDSYQVTTPGIVEVSRSGLAINVACEKEGYEEGKETLVPFFNSWTLGNVLIGGVVGVATDAMTGANNSYPESVQVALKPLPGTTPEPAAAPPKSDDGGAPQVAAAAASMTPAASTSTSADMAAKDELQQRLSLDTDKLRVRITDYNNKHEFFDTSPGATSKILGVFDPELVSLERDRARVKANLTGTFGTGKQFFFDLALYGDDFVVVGHQEVGVRFAASAAVDTKAVNAPVEPAATVSGSGENLAGRDALQQRLSSNIDKLRSRINAYNTEHDGVLGGDTLYTHRIRQVIDPEVVWLEENRAGVKVNVLLETFHVGKQVLFELLLFGDDYAVVDHKETKESVWRSVS